jgi:hypothetical protein
MEAGTCSSDNSAPGARSSAGGAKDAQGDATITPTASSSAAAGYPNGSIEIRIGSGEHVELSPSQVEALYSCAGGRDFVQQQRRAALKQLLEVSGAASVLLPTRSALTQYEARKRQRCSREHAESTGTEKEKKHRPVMLLSAHQQERLRRHLQAAAVE